MNHLTTTKQDFPKIILFVFFFSMLGIGSVRAQDMVFETPDSMALGYFDHVAHTAWCLDVNSFPEEKVLLKESLLALDKDFNLINGTLKSFDLQHQHTIHVWVLIKLYYKGSIKRVGMSHGGLFIDESKQIFKNTKLSKILHRIYKEMEISHDDPKYHHH